MQAQAELASRDCRAEAGASSLSIPARRRSNSLMRPSFALSSSSSFAFRPWMAGKCDAVGIDGGDGAIALAQAEGGMKILRHWTELTDLFALRLVIP